MSKIKTDTTSHRIGRRMQEDTSFSIGSLFGPPAAKKTWGQAGPARKTSNFEPTPLLTQELMRALKEAALKPCFKKLSAIEAAELSLRTPNADQLLENEALLKKQSLNFIAFDQNFDTFFETWHTARSAGSVISATERGTANPRFPIRQYRNDAELIKNAKVLIDAKEYELATKILTKVLTLSPQHVEALECQASIAIKSRAWHDAIKCYTSLAKVRPRQVYNMQLARLHYAAASWDAALELYAHCLKQHGLGLEELFEIYHALGHIELQKQNFSKAIDFYQKAFAKKPLAPHLATLLGVLHICHGSLIQADAYFIKAHNFEPQNFMLWAGLGVLRIRQGDCALAKANLKKALDLKPGHAFIKRLIKLLQTSQGVT